MDIITKKIRVADKGLPDIDYRSKRIVTPEIITLRFSVDNPGPVNGIYPVRAEVAGPCRSAHRGPRVMYATPAYTTEWFYRLHPQFWPAWLIEFGNAHRP
ncbi:hypothetical protein [Streptomyces sp. DW26H14]|uniref:hypothetical protein n=1 Tax=Streptomyces sp. DW26H14 TaxID=3435395 RepID=UPI00403D5FA4